MITLLIYNQQLLLFNEYSGFLECACALIFEKVFLTKHRIENSFQQNYYRNKHINLTKICRIEIYNNNEINIENK